jgi:hypothetical protein
MPDEEIASRVAGYGEKMIKIEVRLWTNSIAETEGEIVPKHAWDSGTVNIETNPSHGIGPNGPVVFGSLAELDSVIQRVLIGQKIKLHLGPRTRRYLIGR